MGGLDEEEVCTNSKWFDELFFKDLDYLKSLQSSSSLLHHPITTITFSYHVW